MITDNIDLHSDRLNIVNRCRSSARFKTISVTHNIVMFTDRLPDLIPDSSKF